MPDTPGHDPSTRDRRFELVVEEFLREREAGRSPDPQRYLDSFPELASGLRDFFAGQDLFDQLAPDLAPQARATPAATGLALPQPGERVGGFELLEELGRGGMGVVYRARQSRLGRVVALKMIRRGQADAAELARFRVEAEAIARLSHPNIVQVFEVGEHGGLPFVALEFCPGGSLAERLRGTTLPPAEAAAVVAALARAMQAAHEHRVIHRDLKPANVLLAGGDAATPLGRLTPKVSDFGLARKLDDPGQTQSGVVLGTPSYMAPEQARGGSREVGPAADVYALGAVLYECLTGRPPFRAATPLETLAQVLETEPVPPRLLNPAVPRDLETVSLKCLRKEPPKRYADAQALADDLGRYLDGRPVQARRVGRAERLLRWARRRPAAAGLAAALVLLAVISLVVGWSQYQRQAEARGRRQQTDAEARALLARARSLLADGWKAADEAKLKQAVTEGERAVAVAGRGQGSDVVKQETITFTKEAEQRLVRWRKNDDLCGALLDVSTPQEGPSYTRSDKGTMQEASQPSVDEQYAAGFRRWGLDVDGRAESEVVARLRAEPDAVVQNVIAALDDWALERRRQGRPEAQWRRLQRIAEGLDHSDTRRQLQQLLLGRVPPRAEGVAGLIGARSPCTTCWELTRGKDSRQVQELRRKMNLAKEPVLTVVLLARASYVAGDAGGAAEVLREAGTARPEQLVLLHQLARLLAEQQRWEEAIGCFRAIRVRRPDLGKALALALLRVGRGREGELVLRDLIRQKPDNPGLHVLLGYVLGQQKEYAAAEAACREAIRLKPDFPEAHVHLGVALGWQDKDKESEAACREAIRLRPDYPLAHDNLGVALSRQGRHKEAEAACRKAIRLKPDEPNPHHSLGNALSGQDKHAAAEAAFREAIRLRHDFPTAHFNLGNTCYRQGKYKEAEVAYREAIRLKPDYAEAHAGVGGALDAQGKHKEAEAALREAIRLSHDQPLTHSNLGVVLNHQGKHKEAEAASREVIRLKPDLPEAHFNLGNALNHQRKHKDAESAFREAIRLKHDYPEAHSNLGLALSDQGKHKEAEAACREAICLKHDYPEAHSNLGHVLSEQGRYKEAEAAFGEAIRLKNDLPLAHKNLGAVLRKQGKLREAEAACRVAILLKPDYPEAHFTLGTALLDQGKSREAEAALREAIRLRHDYPEAHNNLGNALNDQGKPVEAEAALREAIRLKPDLQQAYGNLGLALLLQGRLKEAEKACREAIRLKHDEYMAHYGLGNVLREQGDLPGAGAEFRKAIDLAPGFAQAHCNLGQILRRQGEFRQALAALRRGHQLGTAQGPRWRYPSARWVQQCERLVELEGRLPDLLAGKITPGSPAECLEWAGLCSLKRLHRAAVRFYAEALAQPKLADGLKEAHRYNAACAAALAAAGQGKDADRLDAPAQAQLRQQALNWLKADLQLWQGRTRSSHPAGLQAVRRTLSRWQTDPDLAGVRDAQTLARLSEVERKLWQTLWADVAHLLQTINN